MIEIVCIIQIILVLSVCIISSVDDIKNNVIDNKSMYIASSIGIVIHIILIMLKHKTLNYSYYLDILFTIILSISLYILKIWAGGDAKLTAVIALLYPSYTTKHPLWNFFIIAFIIGIIYLFAESVTLSIKSKNNFSLYNITKYMVFQGKKYLTNLIFISGLNYIYMYCINPIIEIPNNIYFLLCILYIWSINKLQFFTNRNLIKIFIFFDLGMFVITKQLYLSMNLTTYIIIAIFFVIRYFIEQYNYEMIETKEVKKGDILSYETTILMQNSRVKGLPEISDETLRSRLTQEEVDSVKRWEKSKNGLKYIVRLRKIPFAIFISIGVIIYTLIERVNEIWWFN